VSQAKAGGFTSARLSRPARPAIAQHSLARDSGMEWMASSVVQIGTLIFEGVFALFTVYAAYSLFTRTPPALAKQREAMRLPRWFWLLAGTVATIGAAGLFTGLVNPLVGGLAAVWMVCYFIVAALVHITRNAVRDIAPALVFLAISAALVAVHWSDLAPLLASAH